MKFQGSIIKEQNIIFAIVVVKKSAISTISVTDKTREAFQQHFPGIPIVLAS